MINLDKIMNLKCLYFICLITLGASAYSSRESYYNYTFDHSIIRQKIRFEDNNHKLILSRVGDEYFFGTDLGKALVYLDIPYFEHLEFPKKMSLIFDTNEYAEALTQYLEFPFYRPTLVPASVLWDYIFTNKSNPYHIYSFITTGYANSAGESNFAEFFNNVQNIYLPSGGYKILRNRVKETKKLIENIDLSHHEKKLLKSNVKKIKSYLFNNKSLNFFETDEFVNEFIDEVPVFSEEFGFEPIELKKNEMVYVWTDEQTHIMLNDNTDTIFIVDAGSQPLSRGIDGVIKVPEGIRKVNVFMTHFHVDHCQALAAFIHNSQNYEITIFISKHHSMEFTGFLMNYYNHLFNPSDSKLGFKLRIINDQEYFEVDGIHAKIVLQNKMPLDNLNHYIFSCSWVFKEKSKCLKVFTGDLNYGTPQPTNEIINFQVQYYFKELFKNVEGKCAIVFQDYGHFLPINLESVLNTQMSDKKGRNIYPQYVYEHIKSDMGFKIYKIFLNDRIDKKASIIYLP